MLQGLGKNSILVLGKVYSEEDSIKGDIIIRSCMNFNTYLYYPHEKKLRSSEPYTALFCVLTQVSVWEG